MRAAAKLLVLALAPLPFLSMTGKEGRTRVMVSLDKGGKVARIDCRNRRSAG